MTLVASPAAPHVAALRNARAMPLSSLLGVVACYTRQNGWVTKAKAAQTGVRPSLSALQQSIREGDELEPTGEDLAQAQAAIDYVSNIPDPQSDFEAKAVRIAVTGTVFDCEVPTAAALLGMYLRTQVAPSDPAAPGRHVGTPGKRQVFNLRVLKVIEKPGYQPDTVAYFHVMEDPEHNALTWCCSGSNPLDEGWSGQVKATVKEHRDFNGRPETRLARVTKV